ncbi:kynureninase [Amylocystis lapponica]|nr:kynureninase [Amylocystis lapponica]
MASLAASYKLAPADDPLRAFRAEFVLPTNRQMKATAVPPALADAPCTYLCGNSLGPLAKRSKQLVEEELAVWATRGVEGHFDHPHGRNWVDIADSIHPLFADIVGASEAEVACMGTLTANLHLMLNTFYKPTAARHKILCEARAFPSDQYALASQVAAHGFAPADALIELPPRAGEHTLREEDILDVLALEGARIALVLFPGCQYYTGQVFPMQRITRAAKEQGCMVGWDLAHAVGNVPLALHAWDADFAVWCTYKYLNAGPGAIGGLFVHARWQDAPIREAGWWGHDAATRFDMPPRFRAIRGAQGFQQSNPSVLATAALRGALEVLRAAGGVAPLRARSVRLTGCLGALLRASRFWVPAGEAGACGRVGVAVITPEAEGARGAQLSLLFVPAGRGVMRRVKAGLDARGVVGDSRRPDVIRLAPSPLFNTFEDVERAVAVLEEVLAQVEEEGVDVADGGDEKDDAERL